MGSVEKYGHADDHARSYTSVIWSDDVAPDRSYS